MLLLINLKQEYLYLTVFFVISVTLSVFLLLLSYTLSKKKKNDIEKLSAYECGFDPFGTGVSSFEIHFYVVGILFIIFDLELIFLYPWAVQFGILGGSGFCSVMVFLFILTIGFIYEWQKGALDWTKSTVLKRKSISEALISPKLSVMISKPSAPKANISSLIAHDKKQTLATFRTLGSYLEKQFWMFRKTREGVLLTAALVCQLFLVFSYTLGFLRVGFLLVILAFLILSSVNSSRPLLGCYIPKQIFITVCLFASLLMLTQISLFEVVELSRWDAFAEFYHQDYIIVDFYTAMLQLYLFGGIAVFLFVTFEYLVKYSTRKGINLAEFPVVICFASFFMLFLISSFNFFGAYVSLEGVTFSLYILAGMNYNSQNALESGMKYFCLGALSSGILLFGIALIFIITKTLDFSELKFLFDSIRDLPLLLSFSLMFMFFGFWFKLSIFPCHVWTPDVYEGVLTPVTLFFSTVVKFGVFTFFVRVLFFLLGSQTFLFFWRPFFLFAATGSILLGAFGALHQTRIKRFVGYTSINQMGYLFIGVSSGDSLGLQASLLYLFFYIIMVFAFFLVIMYVQKPTGGEEVLFIFQLRGFSQLHRNLSIFLALTLFSMAGIPPLAGFFGKFFLFFSAYKAGNLGLVCFGLVMNIISAFYYLRIIRYLFFEVSRIEVPEFLFFLGTEVVYVLLFNVLFLVLLVILVVFPVFLNDLLRVSEVLVFSVRYVRLW